MDDSPNPDSRIPDPDPLTGIEADPLDQVNAIPRRDFLRMAGMGAGALLATGACATAKTPLVQGIEPTGRIRGDGPGHIVVIGAGAWGGWTSYHLRKRGARVTLIDQYGPANSRATSGDETRGIRSSYGDRTTGDQWCMWARSAIQRWREFDEEWAKPFGTKFFHQTGDVIMRAAEEPFVKRTREIWTAQGVKHEVLDGAEVRKRWPMIGADDITLAITEPDAGVCRSRHATQAVAAIVQRMGVKLVIGRVRPGEVRNGKMDGVVFDDGTVVRGDAYVFACGPWLRKLFPVLMENRMSVPLGYVCYFGTPIGDTRFTYPNLPSYNFPGVTGWPALPVDSRGFRVRGAIAPPGTPTAAGGANNGNNAGRGGGAGSAAGTGGAAASGAGAAAAGNAGTTTGAASGTGAAATGAAVTGTGTGATGAAATGAGGAAGTRQGGNNQRAQPVDPAQVDPDLSNRWAPQERIDGSRRFVALRFPGLAKAPLLETRSCHYESSVNRNFIIDHVPETTNAWIAGVGQAEGFKFGPVVGEYVAMRVLGHEGDPKLVAAFKMPKEEYEKAP